MENRIKEATELKGLQSRLEKLKGEHSVIAMEKRDLLKREKDIQNKINKIQEEIKLSTKGELIVGEHAILRYLQRVELIPPEEVAEKLLTEELLRCWKILGNGKYPIQDTQHHCVIRNSVIVTIE